jgi:hypothetical protein
VIVDANGADNVFYRLAEWAWGVWTGVSLFLFFEVRKRITRRELDEKYESLSKRLDRHAFEAKAAEERAEQSRHQARTIQQRMAMHLAVIGTKLGVPPPDDYTNHGE